MRQSHLQVHDAQTNVQNRVFVRLVEEVAAFQHAQRVTVAAEGVLGLFGKLEGLQIGLIHMFVPKIQQETHIKKRSNKVALKLNLN